tara:strand:- start:1177 stop:2514 length:1338 start_codon:yes stop_codon:yes gene_type:complete
MITTLNTFLKIFLYLLLIYFSLFYFYLGFQKLKDLENVKKNENNMGQNDEILNNKQILDYSIMHDVEIPKIFPEEENEIIEEKITLIVKKNDTLIQLFKPYINNKKTLQQIINLIDNKIDLRKLKIGQEINLYINNIKKNKPNFKIEIPLNFNTDLIIKKNNSSDSYSIDKISLPIETSIVSQKYSIKKSIFEDGKEANVPSYILSELIKLYSFDIDFQRDIRINNIIEIMYEVFYNKNRRTVSYGKIKYTNLTLHDNNLEYFLFKTSEGFFDYFNRNGKNVRKALMKTPLDGAKLSSGFGTRKHPILGYNKFHKGIDFAAAIGTPIYAAGNGTIEYAGRNGGYGKYIRIRHNGSYKTAYAHLNNFNKGISKGVRVNQGQIIGYVGSTGLSTGPHLHYEIIYQGKPINPLKMKLPSTKTLKGAELEKFKNLVKTIYSDFLFNLYE